MVINRCAVGRDGKTPYRRIIGKECGQKLIAVGEQVLAKPKRKKKTSRKMALSTKWKHGTWVGVTARTNEHIVILEHGGAAIRVRTVRRKPITERWSANAVEAIKTTPRHPNPRDEDQRDIRTEEATMVIDVGGDGAQVPEADTEELDKQLRDFKITKVLLEKFGYTDLCPGCEGSILGKRRTHTKKCRETLEKESEKDHEEKKRIERRNRRLGRETDEACVAPLPESPISAPPKTTLVFAPSPRIDATVIEADEETPDLEEEESSDEDGPTERSGNKAKREQEAKEEDAVQDPEEEGSSPTKKRRMEQVRKLKVAIAQCVKHRAGEVAQSMEMEELARDIINKEAAKAPKTLDISRIIQAVANTERCQHSPHEGEDEEKMRWERLYKDFDFFDDVRQGQYLDKAMVVKARQLEMQYFKKLGVYKKVHKSEAMGFKILTTRWVDTNKGDMQNPDYRSRLVGREIKKDNRLDLFAATPPLEVMKALISECAMGQSGNRPLRIATIDIKRAYFYAPVQRKVYIRPPLEDMLPGEEDMVGELQLSLYGTRDAAQNWMKEYSMHLKSIGFEQGRASPCNFVHKSRSLKTTCHGDDFIIIGNLDDIEWMGKQMAKKYDLKMQVLGPENGCQSEVRVLNRIIRWGEHGLEYGPDQRHAEIIVKELDLEGTRPLSSPGTPDIDHQEDVDDKLGHDAERKHDHGGGH